MSYFDHVSCPSCGARFDPEKIAGGPGQPMACPSCGEALGMTDLFGLKDAFAEADGPDVSLNDLSSDSKETPQWTAPGGYAPDPLKGQMPLGARPPRGRAPEHHQPPRDDKPWDKGRGHVVPQGHNGDDDDSDGGGSALDVMRKLKKR